MNCVIRVIHSNAPFLGTNFLYYFFHCDKKMTLKAGAVYFGLQIRGVLSYPDREVSIKNTHGCEGRTLIVSLI